MVAIVSRARMCSAFAFFLLYTVAVRGAIDDGLLLYYDFDVNEGSIVTDRSGNGNTGIVINTTWTPFGIDGGAMSFSDGRYIAVPHQDLPKGSNPVISVSAWLRLGALNNSFRPVFGMGQANSPNTHISFGSGGPIILPRDGTEIWASHHSVDWSTERNFHLDWNHIVYLHDGTNDRMYLDGVLIGEKAVDFFIGANPDVRIGSWEDFVGEAPYFYNGEIDEVRVYDRVLTEAEIVELFENALQPEYVSQTGFSYSPDGDQNTTEYFNDENFHIRIHDELLNPEIRAHELRVTLKQGRSRQTFALDRNNDGSFSGVTSLSIFHPGSVRVITKGLIGGRLRLLRDGDISILQVE